MHKMKMKVILIFKHELYPSPIPSQEANVQVKDSEKKNKIRVYALVKEDYGSTLKA